MDIPSGFPRRGAPLTDEALVDAFSRWQDELLGTLHLLIGNSDAAHDALRRAFIKCWRRRAYLAESPNLRAAVFRIALNTGRDYQAGKGKSAAKESAKPISAEGEPEVGEIELLRRGISALRLEERRIFLLRQNGWLDYEEIGKTVNMPVETVKTRMRLALRKLARAVWPEERPESQSYLELLYGILSDDEAARCRIQAEHGDAAAQAESLKSRITEAAKRTGPRITFPNPADFASPGRPILRRRAARRRLATRRRKQVNPWAKALRWIAAPLMSVLLLASVGGYLYHRDQLAGIAEEHMRLIVAGPERLREGGLNRYTISTTSVTGRPIPVQVNLTVYTATGDRLYEHTERTDSSGRLLVTLPDDLDLPAGAWIETLAVHQDQVRRANIRPVHGHPANTARLFADRRTAVGGDTVGLRAVALRSLPLTAVPDGRVRFILKDSEGARVPAAEEEGDMTQGTATAALRLPEDVPPGDYSLIVESTESRFHAASIPLLVRKERQGPSESGDEAEAAPEPSDGAAGKLDVRFYPEGGAFVAHLENRVYFEAVRGGRPCELAGRIVDDEDHSVASVQTVRDGRGLFSLVPRPERNYRFVLDQPEEAPFERLLPQMDTRKEVVIDTGLGVVEPEKPLEFNVRCAKPGMPLVVSASVRGAQVGEAVFSTKIGPNGQTSNPVEIVLPPEVAGAVRLTVWDYSTSPPRPLAERLVYRRPRQTLSVTCEAKGAAVAPGAAVEWNLLATRAKSDDSSESAEASSKKDASATTGAMLGTVTVFGEVPFPGAGLPETFLLAGSFQDDVRLDFPAAWLDGTPESNTALDLFLGTRGWRFFSSDPPKDSASEPVEAWPALSDNLAELQSRYLDCLAEYQAGRTRVLNTMTTLGAFGGLALLFLLGMTAVLGIPTGLRLWIPGLVTACVCLAVGSILMHPDQLNENPDGQAAFATDFGSRSSGPAAKEVFRCFPPPLVDPPRMDGASAAWNPSLTVDARGQTKMLWTAPARPGSYRVRLDGYALGDAGALGSTEWTVSVDPPADESAIPSPARRHFDTIVAVLQLCMRKLSPSATN